MKKAGYSVSSLPPSYEISMQTYQATESSGKIQDKGDLVSVEEKKIGLNTNQQYALSARKTNSILVFIRQCK